MLTLAVASEADGQTEDRRTKARVWRRFYSQGRARKPNTISEEVLLGL